MKPTKAMSAALLPQYQWFETFTQRFHDAIYDDSEVARSPNNDGIKNVDEHEVLCDALSYFTDHKAEMEAEFREGLHERLEDAKIDFFCETVADHWYEPGKRLQSKRVAQLKSCVHQYIICSGGDPTLGGPGNAKTSIDGVPLPLSPADIARILTVNDQMIRRHIEAWKETHPNWHSLSSDDVFLRRGLGVDAVIDTSVLYREWDYINAYSLAFSAPEKFAQRKKAKVPILVNGDVHLFDERVLFFSPFIPGMDVGQLEVGIISGKAERITYQGEHGGIHEYILGDGPWIDD